MVPNGWEIKKFGNLFSVKSGFGFKHAEYTDVGTPLVKIDNVSHGYVKWDNISYLPDSYKEMYSDIVLKENDILLALNRPITQGMLKIAKLSANDVPSILYQRVGRIEFKSKNLDRDFYFYLLNTEVFRFVSRKSIGSDQPFISTTELKKLELVKPPLQEQQKIAKILTTWDKAISTTERLIDNSTQQKKALMQQLLTGKKRLLDDNGQRFEGEWEEYKLGDITDFIRDGTHGTHERYESGVPMLSAKNITKQNTVDFDDAPYISEDDYNKIHARYTIESGDILLTVVGTLGRVALVPEELAEKFTLQRSVAIIRVAKGVCNQFLMQLFSSSDFTHLLHRKSNSTAQAGVYLGELGKLKILLPSFEEQQKIATVLTNADKEIELLEQQLADLQQEKKALMQVLLTGKKRVVVDE